MATTWTCGRVRDWMAVPVPAITPRTSIATALKLLREHQAQALAVLDGRRFVGLVDEASLLRFTPSEATTLDVYEIREVLDRMTVARAARPVEPVTPDASLPEAAATMRRARARVLPVISDGTLVGLLPWTAVLEAASGDVLGVQAS